MPESPLTVIAGPRPLVLVAPHGGRRDPATRPWASARQRMNDLHTASLTAELAARLGAAALINTGHDRNEIDLNRVSDAHARAPGFLERLHELVAAAVARHGRVTLLTVHGWNVVEPAVDVGLGCTPGADPLAVGPGAAVSPAFAASTLRALLGALGARGIAATVGARYPARHRENLLQLFTTRYRDDGRAPVARLAALAPHVDALQLELGIVLRWPGAWRARLLAACAAALAERAAPALPPVEPAPGMRPAHPPVARRLEFTGPDLCGLVALDAGGRLLLFPPDGGLVLFTGERTGGGPDAVGSLAVQPRADGLGVRLDGPMLRFPDTTPFLDLETGLAAAHLVEAAVEIDFVRAHGDAEAADFGTVAGRVTLDGRRLPVTGHAFAEDGPPRGPWPRLRAALRLDDRSAIAVTLGLGGDHAHGFLCRGGRHLPIVAGHATLGPAAAPLARFALEIELAGGERLRVAAQAVVSLPVIRARTPAPQRLEFAACRLEDGAPPAGWCEVAGV